MAKKFVRVIEDIEEALSREVRRILFGQQRHAGESGVTFREVFDTFTGELRRQPIEPQFYDDTAEAQASADPRFTLRLLKLYEDLQTKRLLPPYGEELTQVIPGPGAYQVKFGGENAITTDGTADSTIQLTHRKIRDIDVGDWIRLLTGANQGTYQIASVTLNGNGPHTITLDPTLLLELPAFNYNKDAGVITFNSFMDLTVVRPGDIFIDAQDQTFTITAVNADNATIAVTSGSSVVNGADASISRSGAVLQNDDEGNEICYQILDPSLPIANKGTRYSKKSQLIPYTFLYYIKIVSRERDDHIAIANKMMQVFNPPRGMLSTVVRSELSADSAIKKDVPVGTRTIFVENASLFFPNDCLRILDNVSFGEEAIVESTNQVSNSITLKSAITGNYTLENLGQVVSNTDFWTFERDFINHQTEDQEAMQLWVHRFTFRVEAWVESRIELTEDNGTETTEKEVGDVNYIQACLEDMEGNVLDEDLVT